MQPPSEGLPTHYEFVARDDADGPATDGGYSTLLAPSTLDFASPALSRHGSRGRPTMNSLASPRSSDMDNDTAEWNDASSPAVCSTPKFMVHRANLQGHDEWAAPVAPPPSVSDYTWATRYSEAIAECEPQRQLVLLSTLREDFLHACKLYGSVICVEAGLPPHRKTIKPVAMGGVAGGSKFKTAAILFKFARDPLINESEYLYGGAEPDEEASRKAMGNELKAAGALYKVAHGTSLQVPLMAILDYRGFRLCCQAVLPIAGGQLVYGSCDGGMTALDGSGNAVLQHDVAIVSSRLNLAMHPVKEFSTGAIKQLSLPIDIEVHNVARNGDGAPRYYALDVARLMPPTAPARGKERRIFCEMFRPEFVRLHHEPLSSDCFSRFGLPGAAIHDERVTQATIHLTQTIVPTFSASLTHSLDRVNFRFHEAGINMRYMGLVRHHSADETVRRVLLEQMVARVLKKRLERQLRELVVSIKEPLTYPYQELAATFFAECASGGSFILQFWSEVKQDIVKKFGDVALSLEESQSQFVLLYAIQTLDHVLQALADMAGIRVRRELVNVDKMSFLPTDFAFVPVVKEMQISTVAMAQSLVVEAAKHSGEIRDELLREAVQVLGNEAVQSPSDYGVVLKLALAQTALCFDQHAAPKPLSDATAALVGVVEPRLATMLLSLEGTQQFEPLYLQTQLYEGKCRALIASENIGEAARVWCSMFACIERLVAVPADALNTVQLYFLKQSEALVFQAEAQTHVLEVLAELFALVASHDDVERLHDAVGGVWNSMSSSQVEAVLMLAASVKMSPRHAPHVVGADDRVGTNAQPRRVTMYMTPTWTPSFHVAAYLSHGAQTSYAEEALRHYLARYPFIVFRGLASMCVDDRVAAVILRMASNQCGLDLSRCRVTDALAESVMTCLTHLDVCNTGIGDGFLHALSRRGLLALLRHLFVDDSSCTLDLPDIVALKTLSAAYCDLDADTVVAFALRAPTSFPVLHSLDLSFTACVTRDSLLALSAGVTSLQALNVSFSCVAPVMEHLSMTSLRALQIASCHLTDSALRCVCIACPGLSTLDASSNVALTNALTASVARLPLVSLKLSRCVLLTDDLLSDDKALAWLGDQLLHLDLLDCPQVSSRAVSEHMDANPMRLVLGGRGAPSTHAMAPEVLAVEQPAGRIAPTLLAPAIASVSRMLRERHKEGCVVVYTGNDGRAAERVMRKTCDKLAMVTDVRACELWHRCDELDVVCDPPTSYSSLIGLLRELFGVPCACSVQFVAQWVELLARRLCSDPSQPPQLARTRRALQMLLMGGAGMGSADATASTFSATSDGEVCTEEGDAEVLSMARSLALDRFRATLSHPSLVVVALQSLQSLDPQSDALLADVLAAKLPHCVFLLSCSESAASRSCWLDALKIAHVVHMVQHVRDAALAHDAAGSVLPTLVAQLPDMLRRTLFAACVLDDPIDVPGVAHMLCERVRVVEEHLTMLTHPMEPHAVKLVEVWQHGHFVVLPAVRLVCATLLEQTVAHAVPIYLRASSWLDRHGAQPVRIVELLQRTMVLSSLADGGGGGSELRQGYLAAVLRGASSLGVTDFARARDMLRAAGPQLAIAIAHPELPLSVRRVALQLLQMHVRLLFMPWGVCVDLAEAERLLQAQQRLRDVFSADEQLEAVYVDQVSCTHRDQLFALPVKSTAMTADRHDFAQGVPLRPVSLRQLSPRAGPCGTSALAARVSLHVREMTLQGRWHCAQSLFNDTMRVCDSGADVENRLVALACVIEAVALHKGLMGDVAGAVDAALEAHEEIVFLFPALPVHPLVEHLFLPLSLFTSDPHGNLVVMLRQMDRFALCIPQFHLEALVVMGQCADVPPLLQTQIGLELLHHQRVLGNTRYHAYALRALGEATQSGQILERAANLARDSHHDFQELTCLKSLLQALPEHEKFLQWQDRHDFVWRSLQTENESATADQHARHSSGRQLQQQQPISLSSAGVRDQPADVMLRSAANVDYSSPKLRKYRFEGPKRADTSPPTNQSE